jgi:hypothetical protein
MTSAALAAALTLSPLSEALCFRIDARRGIVGGAFLAILVGRRIVMGPRGRGWRLAVLQIVFSAPVFLGAVLLVVANPPQARVAATVLAAFAALCCWATLAEYPFPTMGLVPELRRCAMMRRRCAVCGVAGCWGLVILSWVV